MSKKDNKDYSAAEVISLVQRAVGAITSGNLSGTVFGAPEDSSNYDVMSANAQGMMNNFIDRYVKNMAAAARFKRTAAVAATTGMGMAGVTILDKLAQFNPGAANALLGHHGIDEALKSMLRNANGLASATGRPLGGVMDPSLMSRNMMFAATQGALAINNAFTSKGAVDARFTGGLSLQQTASVANSILADRSHYEEWEKEQHRKTQIWQAYNAKGANDLSYMRKNGILTEGEVSAFKNGTAMTDAAVRSFNDHIKTFQKEMNGFVASVSKITGSFESAVDFLQDMTNGRAFAAGEAASRARRRAAQTAANLRVLAADTGLDPRALHGMARDFGSLMNAGMGKDVYEQYFGDRSVAANVGAMGAAAYAAYVKAHPGASAEELGRVKLGLSARSSGLGRGDAVKHNVLLAEAVRMGRISKEDAMKMARNGDQEAVYDFVRKIYGVAVDNILSSEPLMDIYTRRNADVVNELNTISLDEGTANEGVLKSQRQALSDAKMTVSSMLRTTSALKGDRNVARDVESMYKESMLDSGALKSAGLNDKQVQDLQEMVKQKRLGVRGIRDQLRKMGADEFTLNRAAFKLMSTKLHDKYGGQNSKEIDDALAQFDAMRDMAVPEFTAEDVKRYRVSKATTNVARRLQEQKAAYAKAKSEGDEDKAYEVLKGIRDRIGHVAAGRDENYTLGQDFIDFQIKQSAVYSGTGLLRNLAQDKRALAVGEAKAAYVQAMAQGRTSSQAWDAVGDVLQKKYGIQGKAFSRDMQQNTEERLRNYTTVKAVTAGVDLILQKSTFDETTKRNVTARVWAALRDESKRRNMEREVMRDSPKLNGLAREKEVIKRLMVQMLQTSLGEEAHSSKTAMTDEQKKLYSNAKNFDAASWRRAASSKEVDKVVEGQYLAAFDMLGVNENYLNQLYDGQNASEEEMREVSKQGAAWNEKQKAFLNAEGRAVMGTNEAVRSGAQALGNENTASIIGRADQIDAEEHNKALGAPGELDLAEARIAIGFKDKADYYKRMFGVGSNAKSFEARAREATRGRPGYIKAFTKHWGGEEANEISATHIANLLDSIRQETMGMERRAANKYIWEKYGDTFDMIGLRGILLEAKDSQGKKIKDVREIFGAFSGGLRAKDAAGGVISDADLEEALARGAVSTDAMNGDKNLNSDSSVTWLQIIAKSVEAIAKKSATDT